MDVAKERDKLVEEGYTIISEHPELRFCLLAKKYPRSNFIKKAHIRVVIIPKFGNIKRIALTETDFEKLKQLMES